MESPPVQSVGLQEEGQQGVQPTRGGKTKVRVAVLVSGHLRGLPSKSCAPGQLGLVPSLCRMREQHGDTHELEFFVHMWDTMDSALPLHQRRSGSKALSVQQVTREQANAWFAPLKPCWVQVDNQETECLPSSCNKSLKEMQRPHLLGVKYQYIGMLKALDAAIMTSSAGGGTSAFDYVYRIRADHCHRFNGSREEVPNQPPDQLGRYCAFLQDRQHRQTSQDHASAADDDGSSTMLTWTTTHAGSTGSHDVLAFAAFPVYSRVLRSLVQTIDDYFAKTGALCSRLPVCHETVFHLVAESVKVSCCHFTLACVQ